MTGNLLSILVKILMFRLWKDWLPEIGRGYLIKLYKLGLYCSLGWASLGLGWANTLSLAKSIELALHSQVEMRNALVDEKLQQLQKNLYLSALLPQVAYNLSTTYYTNIPARFIPDFITPATTQLLSQLGIRRGDGQPVTPPEYDPSKGFFTKMNTNWNIFQDFAIQQIIFEPDIFIAMASTKALRAMAKARTQEVEEQLILNTSKAYFTLAILHKRMRIADSLLSYTLTIQRELQAMSAQGLQDEDALIQMQLNLHKVQGLQRKLLGALRMARRNFAYLLGLEVSPNLESDLELSSDISLEKLTQTTNVLQPNYAARADRKQLETLVRLRKLGVLQKQLAYLPRLSFFANLGYINLSNEFQLSTFGSSKGFRNDFVGLKFKVDIFAGFKKRHELQMAQLEYTKVLNSLQDSDRGLDLQSKNAQTQALSSLEDLQSLQTDLELNTKIYSRLLLKRQTGMSSRIEVLHARIRVAEAEDRYLGGFLDAIYARLNWHQALGNLKLFLAEIDAQYQP